MKIISAAIVLALALFCNAEPVEMYCRVFTKNCVLCSSEKIPGQMRLYWLKKDGSWVRKQYFFGDDEVQAVHVWTYKDYYMNECFFSELLKIDSVARGLDSEIEKIQKYCNGLEDSMLYEIRSGNKIDLLDFEKGFGADYEEPFSMYCGFSTLVETKKFDGKGRLVRKRSYSLEPGDYCRKFLLNDRIYWDPKNSKK